MRSTRRPARAQESHIGAAVIPVSVVGPLVVELGAYELEEPAGTLKEASRAQEELLDTAKRRVTLKLLSGFFARRTVHYLRTDASVDVVAALEGSTLAKNLDAAPGAGSNAARSARSAISRSSTVLAARRIRSVKASSRPSSARAAR